MSTKTPEKTPPFGEFMEQKHNKACKSVSNQQNFKYFVFKI